MAIAIRLPRSQRIGVHGLPVAIDVGTLRQVEKVKAPGPAIETAVHTAELGLTIAVLARVGCLKSYSWQKRALPSFQLFTAGGEWNAADISLGHLQVSLLFIEVVVIGDTGQVALEVHTVVSTDLSVFQALGVNAKISQGLKAEAGKQA